MQFDWSLTTIFGTWCFNPKTPNTKPFCAARSSFCSRVDEILNLFKMLFNIAKIKPIFGDFAIRYRFSMSFDAGLSIVRNRFCVHIRC